MSTTEAPPPPVVVIPEDCVEAVLGRLLVRGEGTDVQLDVEPDPNGVDVHVVITATVRDHRLRLTSELPASHPLLLALRTHYPLAFLVASVHQAAIVSFVDGPELRQLVRAAP